MHILISVKKIRKLLTLMFLCCCLVSSVQSKGGECRQYINPKYLKMIPKTMAKIVSQSIYIDHVDLPVVNGTNFLEFEVPKNQYTTIMINRCQNLDFQSQDDLAAILAHEFAHLEYNLFTILTRKYANKREDALTTKSTENMKNLKTEEKNLDQMAKDLTIEEARNYVKPYYLKAIEIQADLRGIVLTHSAGFNPCSFVRLFSSPSWEIIKTKHTGANVSYRYLSGQERARISKDFISKKSGIQCTLS